MQTMRIRKDVRAGVGAMALVAVLAAAAAIGFVTLFSNDYVSIEGRIYEVDSGSSPWTAKVDVRVTNKAGGDLYVEFVEMTVWADAARTIALSTARTVGVSVPAGQSITRTVDVEITNPDAYGGHVWVDVEASWRQGEQRYHEQAVGREISVGGALAGLL